MATHATFAEIAALAGDPGRAGMLHALMDGRALTASELARVAGIAPQTASGHLSRMTAIGLVSVERQTMVPFGSSDRSSGSGSCPVMPRIVALIRR